MTASPEPNRLNTWGPYLVVYSVCVLGFLFWLVQYLSAPIDDGSGLCGNDWRNCRASPKANMETLGITVGIPLGVIWIVLGTLVVTLCNRLLRVGWLARGLLATFICVLILALGIAALTAGLR